MSESSMTQRALAQAMKKLMQERSFLKISVSDICAECNISRKCFYYHFMDKYDLVNWIFYTEFLEQCEQKDYGSIWELLDDVCCYLYDQRAFIVSAFQAHGQNSLRDYMSGTLRVMLEQLLGKIFVGEEDRAVFAEFFADAYMFSLEKWLVNYPNYGPKEYAKLMHLPFLSANPSEYQELDTRMKDGFKLKLVEK